MSSTGIAVTSAGITRSRSCESSVRIERSASPRAIALAKFLTTTREGGYGRSLTGSQILVIPALVTADSVLLICGSQT